METFLKPQNNGAGKKEMSTIKHTQPENNQDLEVKIYLQIINLADPVLGQLCRSLSILVMHVLVIHDLRLLLHITGFFYFSCTNPEDLQKKKIQWLKCQDYKNNVTRVHKQTEI